MSLTIAMLVLVALLSLKYPLAFLSLLIFGLIYVIYRIAHDRKKTGKMRLENNQQLYDYLVAISTKLKSRGAVELSQHVLAASRTSGIPATEFLGESRIALRRVQNEQKVLTDEECSDLRDVLRQLDEAITRR